MPTKWQRKQQNRYSRKDGYKISYSVRSHLVYLRNTNLRNLPDSLYAPERQKISHQELDTVFEPRIDRSSQGRKHTPSASDAYRPTATEAPRLYPLLSREGRNQGATMKRTWDTTSETTRAENNTTIVC